MKNLWVGTALSLLILSAGCGTTGILRADFDEIDINPESSYLPGTPEGDQIQQVQGAFETTDGPPEGECLRISGQANFVVAQHELPGKYQITMRFAFVGQTFTPGRIVVLGDGGEEALIIERDGGHLHIQTGDGLPIPTLDVAFGVVHELTITIRKGSHDPIDVQFKSPGEPDVFRQKLNLIDNDFERLETVQIVGSSISPMYLDGIFIYAKE